ncbi:MAG: hypothetical protein Q6361_01590 [Candidatus Hermodarchaeota archaeon]|nr:hypothetical protein [Candidatus Hermodarchaeota archaeon]
MAEEYGIILRITFLIHIIIGFIFGLGLLILPDLIMTTFGFSFSDPVPRMMGAMMLALTMGSILALMTKEWARVKILVEIELIWSILGTIVVAYHMLMPPLLNIYGWILAALLLVLFFLFLLSYYMEIKK